MSVNVVDNNVTVTTSQEVEVANTLVANTITNEYPNTITVKSNEFAVVGDALFATTKEEVPGWMRELVGDLARSATADTYNAMTGFNYNLYNAMIALQVAENKYQQAINTRVTDQEAFVQAVETLNSTTQNAVSEIVDIKQTYATKDFATATAAQTLEASLNGGAIKSSLGQLASAMTNQYGTMAQRMDVLESTFEDLELGVEGYANATSGLETFVGKNDPNTNAPVITSSKFYQDLNVYLAGTNYTTGGTNTLVNQVTAAATGVESKFAYNSSLMLNGIAYNSGFGLATSLTPGSGIPVGSSEFWINADKFKLTTTGYNGIKYSPFTVDGTNGSITFNGKVTFGNNQTGTIDEAIAASIESVVVGDKNINITDNLIPTTSLITDINNTGYQFIGDPVKGLVAGIDTFAEVQVTLDGDVGAVDEVYSPYVDEVTMPYYYRFGIKGVTTLTDKFYVTLIRDTDVISYHNVTVTLEPGMVMDANSWYIVDGIINPVGSGAGSSGRILTPALEKVATISNFNMVAGTAKVLLGWVGSCTISRMKLAKITADTFTGSVATVDYVEGKGYVVPEDLGAAGTTVIDGGRITTGYISANRIAAGAITADKLGPSTGTSTTWTGGGLVSTNFNGNASGNIGTPTQGFRLSSDAIGTSSDPNIYGGYVKGVNIEAGRFYGSGYCVAPNGVLGPPLVLESNGYDAVNSTSQMELYSPVIVGYNSVSPGTFNISTTTNTTSLYRIYASTVTAFNGSVTISLQVSINGGGWSTISTRTGTVNNYFITTYTGNGANSHQFRVVLPHGGGSNTTTKAGLIQVSVSNLG